MNEMFKYSLRFTVFTLQKERLFIGLWIGGLLFIAGVMLVAFENQFTSEELQGLLIMKDNPAHIALQGPFFPAESFQVGHFYAVEMHLFTLIAVAIFNIFLVMQSTRGDEEKGRIEILRSLPFGRLSILHGVMIVASIVNVLLGILHGILLFLLGISGITISGAFNYGMSLAATGFFFAALSAFLSQFSHSTRTVMGAAFIILIASYLLRAVGDVTAEPLSLISPLGLPLRAETFVSNHIWPFLVMLMLAFVLCGLAYLLNARRDIGQGLLPEPHGRNGASIFLRTSLGLVWRQHRNTLLAWTIGLFGLGAALGGIMRDAEHFAGENGAFQMLIPASADFTAVELFTMFLNVSFAVVCIAPVLVLIFKILREEKDGRAEPVLSRGVSRTQYMSGFIAIAFLASLLMPFVTSIGMWWVSSLLMEVPLPFVGTLRSMMVYLPGLWVMLGLGVFVVGIFPKVSVLCWGYFIYIFVVGFFGELLDMPEGAMNLSPFSHIPQLPLEDARFPPLLMLTGIALVLTMLGFGGYKQREMMA